MKEMKIEMSDVLKTTWNDLTKYSHDIPSGAFKMYRNKYEGIKKFYENNIWSFLIILMIMWKFISQIDIITSNLL